MGVVKIIESSAHAVRLLRFGTPGVLKNEVGYQRGGCVYGFSELLPPRSSPRDSAALPLICPNTLKNRQNQPRTAKPGQNSRLLPVKIFASGRKFLEFGKILASLNRRISYVQKRPELLKFDCSMISDDHFKEKLVKSTPSNCQGLIYMPPVKTPLQ